MREYMIKGRRLLSMIAAVSVLVFMAGIATAKTTVKDEKKLKTDITMLDKTATLPNGDTVVTDRLSKEFNVTGDQIKGLRDKGMKYGEIAAIYAFADKMSGGVTDDNVNKVMSLREGKKGWGTIAKSLNVDLGSVASKVSSIEKDAHKDIKKASTEATSSGAGGGGKTEGGSGGGGKSKSGGGGGGY